MSTRGSTSLPASNLFCVLLHNRRHSIELLLHIGNQLELGAAAIQILLRIVDAEIVVAGQRVRQDPETACRGIQPGAPGLV